MIYTFEALLAIIGLAGLAYLIVDGVVYVLRERERNGRRLSNRELYAHRVTSQIPFEDGN